MDLKKFQKEGLACISAASTADELLAAEKKYFGRKSGLLTSAMKELKDFSAEEKREKGAELNVIKQSLSEAIKKRQQELEGASFDSLAVDDKLDVTMNLPTEERGHLHLIPEFIRQVEEVFGRMGFDVTYGPEIETEELHFDKLNFPKDHPAREWADIFYMKDPASAPADSSNSSCGATASREGKPGNRHLLRGHTSPGQIRYMQEHKPPFRMICPGKTYRKDADATHSPMFHQFEGLMIGKDISLRHLKGVMVAACKELISPDLDFRFRTGYFPFTEPSMEMDVKWRGEDKTKEGDWLEVVGCGMVHPNVLTNVGIDPDEWQGFAFGFGVERLVMIKHQIPNIRLFYQGGLEFLRQF